MYWDEIKGIAWVILVISIPIWIITMSGDMLISFAISYLMAGVLVAIVCNMS